MYPHANMFPIINSTSTFRSASSSKSSPNKHDVQLFEVFDDDSILTDTDHNNEFQLISDRFTSHGLEQPFKGNAFKPANTNLRIRFDENKQQEGIKYLREKKAQVFDVDPNGLIYDAGWTIPSDQHKLVTSTNLELVFEGMLSEKNEGMLWKIRQRPDEVNNWMR